MSFIAACFICLRRYYAFRFITTPSFVLICAYAGDAIRPRLIHTGCLRRQATPRCRHVGTYILLVRLPHITVTHTLLIILLLLLHIQHYYASLALPYVLFCVTIYRHMLTICRLSLLPLTSCHIIIVVNISLPSYCWSGLHAIYTLRLLMPLLATLCIYAISRLSTRYYLHLFTNINTTLLFANTYTYSAWFGYHTFSFTRHIFHVVIVT